MRKFMRFSLPLILVAGAIAVVVVLGIIAGAKRPERKDDSEQAMLVDAIPKGIGLQLAYATACMVLAALILMVGARLISRDITPS